MNSFSEQWLQLRAPFDSAARSTALIGRFRDVLRTDHHGTIRLVDLAAGSGAGCRALAPEIGCDQDWLLVDGDPQLFAAQTPVIGRWAQEAGWEVLPSAEGVRIDTGSARWLIRSLQLDLAQSLETLQLTDCHGVTTSAFLDLVSADWIDRLCALLSRHRLPLLAMLTVDGRRTWHPTLPADAIMEAAFRRHQAGDKGFGPALGERAAPYLAQRICAHGYAVQTAPSDWRIGTSHHEMLLRMVTESATVAKEVAPECHPDVDAWVRARRTQIGANGLALAVGHLDVLAVPT